MAAELSAVRGARSPYPHPGSRPSPHAERPHIRPPAQARGAGFAVSPVREPGRAGVAMEGHKNSGRRTPVCRQVAMAAASASAPYKGTTIVIPPEEVTLLDVPRMSEGSCFPS